MEEKILVEGLAWLVAMEVAMEEGFLVAEEVAVEKRFWVEVEVTVEEGLWFVAEKVAMEERFSEAEEAAVEEKFVVLCSQTLAQGSPPLAVGWAWLNHHQKKCLEEQLSWKDPLQYLQTLAT